MESLSFSTHTDICQDAFISPGLSVIAYGRIPLHPSNPDMRPHILSIPYITCLLSLGSGKHFASSCAMLGHTEAPSICLWNLSGKHLFLSFDTLLAFLGKSMRVPVSLCFQMPQIYLEVSVVGPSLHWDFSET